MRPCVPIRLTIVLAGLTTLLLSACSKSPDRLQRIALESEKSAREARTNQDAAKARRAATDAMAAVTQLRKLAVTNPQTNAIHQFLGKAEIAAREATLQADFAQEEQERRDALASWSSTLYRRSRPVVLGTLFRQLATATEAAGRRVTNETHTPYSTLAKQAWELVRVVGVAEPLADGSPDWVTARTQLSIWSTNQPLELRAFLSLAYLSVGQPAVALAEFETIDPSSLTELNDLRFYRMGRTLLYTEQGWNCLAAQEAALFNESNSAGRANEAGRFMVAGLHAFMAYDAGKKREFAKMDAEIAQIVRVWPENPLVVYLTGEKLAAGGEWERAADSLEASVAGTKDEWMAQRLAERARELRDGRGSTKAFVLDARFLIPFVARGVSAQAENSSIGKNSSSAVEQAKSFGKTLLDNFKLPGGENSTKAETRK